MDARDISAFTRVFERAMRGHDVGELAVTKISPLAPKTVPEMPAIEGVKLSTAAAGIRYRDRTDVLLVQLAPGTVVAGVFTKSKCASAPVDWCRQNLKSRSARANSRFVKQGVPYVDDGEPEPSLIPTIWPG